MAESFLAKIARFSTRFRWLLLVLLLFIGATAVYAISLRNQAEPSAPQPPLMVIFHWPDAENTDDLQEHVLAPAAAALAAVAGLTSIEAAAQATSGTLTAVVEDGFDREQVEQELVSALAVVELPLRAGFHLLTFGEGRFPEIIALISAEALSAAELSALVETEGAAMLADVAPAAELNVSGGPDLSYVPPPAESVAEAEAGPEDPGRLPEIFIAGAASLGLEITYAQEVTVDFLRSLSEGENAAEDVMLVLQIFPQDLLEYIPPETLSFLPAEYVNTLPPDIAAALDKRSADFGGLGQFTLAKAIDALSGQAAAPATATASIPPTAVALTPTLQAPAEPTQAPPPVPGFEPVPLPESWRQEAARFGFTMETTADVTPEFVQEITSATPDLIADLTPDMWRAMPAEVTAVALPLVEETLDPLLAAQLSAIQSAFQGEAPKPAELPESWRAAAAAFGFVIETTADIPPQAFGLLAGNVPPELLAELTPEIVLGLSPAALAQLPPEVLAVQDEGMLQTMANILVAAAQFAALKEGAVKNEAEVAAGPTRLPAIFIQEAAIGGFEIEFAQDISPEFVRIFLEIDSDNGLAFSLLTPAQLRQLQPEVIALLPPAFLATLPPDTRADLETLAHDHGGAGALYLIEAAAKLRLPDRVIEAAAAAGYPVEEAPELSPLLVQYFGSSGAEGLSLLAELSTDNLLLLPAESIAWLPAPFLSTLEPKVHEDLNLIAVEFGGAGGLAAARVQAGATATALSMLPAEEEMPASPINDPVLESVSAVVAQIFLAELNETSNLMTVSALLSAYDEGQTEIDVQPIFQQTIADGQPQERLLPDWAPLVFLFFLFLLFLGILLLPFIYIN